MARVKLRCIMGCPGLKDSYREKGLFELVIIFLILRKGYTDNYDVKICFFLR